VNDLLKTMTYPGDVGTVDFMYDDNNQLKTYKIPGLMANNDTLTYQYRWNAIREITMPGNLKRTVTLDALQRPARIEVKGYGPTPGNNGVPIMDHKYTYDAVSNISKKTTLDGDYVYTYDNLDRLTGALPPLSLRQSASNPNGLPDEKYRYDGVHNRMSSQHQPGVWVYNANNELTSWGLGSASKAIEYDLNGSTIKEESGAPVSATREYVYDAQDRMVEVKDNSVSVAKYAYDPMGRRIWRQAGADITWFLYSDEGLIEELTAANTSIRTYGWNPGGMWGTDTIWQKDANGVFLSNNDHLYTTDVLTGSVSGNKSWGGVRESFGKTTVQAGAATTYLMRFPGQWEDGVGLTYNFNRHYSPVTASYTQIDRLGIKSDLNFYRYAGGNSIKYIDRYGNEYEPITPVPLGAGPVAGPHSFCEGMWDLMVDWERNEFLNVSGGSRIFDPYSRPFEKLPFNQTNFMAPTGQVFDIQYFQMGYGAKKLLGVSSAPIIYAWDAALWIACQAGKDTCGHFNEGNIEANKNGWWLGRAAYDLAFGYFPRYVCKNCLKCQECTKLGVPN
jgi:RHS repeat-associated protein